jgi:hypothetical protein
MRAQIVHEFHIRKKNLVVKNWMKEEKAEAKAEFIFKAHIIVHVFHFRQSKLVAQNCLSKRMALF